MFQDDTLVQHSGMPHFFSTHKGLTEMEYSFVYTPGGVKYIIKHVLRNPWTDRNGSSVYISMYAVVEYYANQNVTPVTNNI